MAEILGETLIGRELTCAVTGKKFVGAAAGISVNYARDAQGNVISDEGVHIAEERNFESRQPVIYAYLSSDGSKVTGWKGNAHAKVTYYNESRSGFGGTKQARFRACDNYGNWWQGRGPGLGMYCTLRPMKAPK